MEWDGLRWAINAFVAWKTCTGGFLFRDMSRLKPILCFFWCIFFGYLCNMYWLFAKEAFCSETLRGQNPFYDFVPCATIFIHNTHRLQIAAKQIHERKKRNQLSKNKLQSFFFGISYVDVEYRIRKLPVYQILPQTTVQISDKYMKKENHIVPHHQRHCCPQSHCCHQHYHYTIITIIVISIIVTV